MKVTVEFSGLQRVEARFAGAGPRADAEMARGVREATELVYRQGRDNIGRMFQNPGKMQSLLEVAFDRITNGYRGSVSIEGIGYVTQEFGGTRTYEILPRNKKALHFFASTPPEEVFARRVIHPPLPERSFLRLALDQKRDEIRAAFERAAERILDEK